MRFNEELEKAKAVAKKESEVIISFEQNRQINASEQDEDDEIFVNAINHFKTCKDRELINKLIVFGIKNLNIWNKAVKETGWKINE